MMIRGTFNSKNKNKITEFFFFLFDGRKGVNLVYHLVIFWDQLQCIGRGRILLVNLSDV